VLDTRMPGRGRVNVNPERLETSRQVGRFLGTQQGRDLLGRLGCGRQARVVIAGPEGTLAEVLDRVGGHPLPVLVAVGDGAGGPVRWLLVPAEAG
jgi:hypothetical protein